jgi:hypothetical protein
MPQLSDATQQRMKDAAAIYVDCYRTANDTFAHGGGDLVTNLTEWLFSIAWEDFEDAEAESAKE